MSSEHQQLDKFFRKSLGLKPVIKDFLKNRLSDEVKEKINIESIEKQNTSYVSEAYRAFYSDMVYRVDTKKGAGYVYFLIEAESTAKELMPLRLLEYNTCIIRHHVEQEMKKRKKGKRKEEIKFPAVLNFVLYFGQTDYTYAGSILDAFADKKLARLMFEGNFILPLRKQSRASLLKDGQAALAEILLSSQGDLVDFIVKNPDVGKLLVDSLYGEAAIFHIISRSKYDLEESKEKLIKFVPDKKVSTMLNASLENYREEGRNEGKQEGRREGKQEGIIEGMLKVAKTMLKNGFDFKTIAKNTGLKIEQIKALT